MTKKYLSLERLTEYDELIKSTIDAGDKSVKSYVDTELAKKANSSHSHAISDVTNLQSTLDAKATQSSLNSHTGNSTIHVTSDNKTQWNSAYSHSTSAHAPSNAEKNIIVGIQKNGTDLTVDSSTRKINITVPTTAAEVGASPSTHNHDDKYDAKGSANTALNSAKSYTDTKTNGMATTTVVDNKISSHNTSATAHSDIRDLVSALTTKVNNFLDVDDTTTDQLSEVLTLISNNKGTLDSLTSGKVNVSDIVDNLTTANNKKVLSANQGVELKSLIDALQTAVNGKSDDGHGHAISDVTNLQSTLNSKAAQSSLDSHTGNTTVHITGTERTNWNAAKTHADSAHAPSNAQANVIESIKVNGTAQTISSKSVNITVPTKASDIGAAPTTHSHAISDITNLQTTLNDVASGISANTSSISALTDRTKALEDKVGDGFEEITSTEIANLFK